MAHFSAAGGYEHGHFADQMINIWLESKSNCHSGIDHDECALKKNVKNRWRVIVFKT